MRAPTDARITTAARRRLAVQCMSGGVCRGQLRTSVNGVQAAKQRQRSHTPVHATQPEMLGGKVLEGVGLLHQSVS